MGACSFPMTLNCLPFPIHLFPAHIGAYSLIPPGMTEAQVLTDIDNVAKPLARMFAASFPYLELCDIEQEIRLEGWKVIQREVYDPAKQTLAAFLYSHCKNRLINKRRNEFFRPECPCAACAQGSFCGLGGEPCERFVRWRKRNHAKANLRQSLPVDLVDDEDERNMKSPSSVENDVQGAELSNLIDEHLSVELRSYYLQMLAGMKLPKVKREKVQRAVLEILQEAGIAGDLLLPKEEVEGHAVVRPVADLVGTNGPASE